MVHKRTAADSTPLVLQPLKNSMTMNPTTLARGISSLLVIACFAAPASALADQKQTAAKEARAADKKKSKRSGGKATLSKRRSAQDAALCQEGLVGTFKVMEKRGAQGASHSDAGETVKIARQGPAFSVAFFEPDGKQIVDYAGQPNVTSLPIIAPDTMRRMIFGSEKHPEFDAVARALQMCGLGGEELSILRVADKERAAYTLSAGVGLASFTATLEKVK